MNKDEMKAILERLTPEDFAKLATCPKCHGSGLIIEYDDIKICSIATSRTQLKRCPVCHDSHSGVKNNTSFED